ncbi:Capsular polysaccharide export system protein KpsC [hydrothermal vent metagenome]|uniref:Capsular polysaccharide export system protein KpsC n=1 Tax=hydrothermal vent metagenome TaxID=652676 RepID=A0A1W1D4B9_9ZZZZ
MKYSISKQLIKNTKYFLNITYYSFFHRLFHKKGTFYGWGRKKSGLKAIELAKKYQTSFVLLEDGFIRSLGLGVDNSPSFSIVEDDVGIYYDATSPSKLENILNTYDFQSDNKLMKTAKEAIELIKKHHISKYNNAPDIDDNFFKNDTKQKILIIAQTAGDASLQYGLGDIFSTKKIINDAINENPQASIYIKIHPDVLTGKKQSDIKQEDIPKNCTIIDQNINPISLLKHFTKVYTKTSGMGMEALLLDIEVTCYGVPFYSGWGLTNDKQKCNRRNKKLTTKELFAGAYILYTRYYNPYTKQPSNIIDTIQTLLSKKSNL